jgi:hypothetical protein
MDPLVFGSHARTARKSFGYKNCRRGLAILKPRNSVRSCGGLVGVRALPSQIFWK